MLSEEDDVEIHGLADNSVGQVIDTLPRHDLILIDLCRPCNYADAGGTSPAAA